MYREECVKMCQEKAKVYSKAVAKKRRIEKCKRVAVGISLSAFFIAAFGKVGKDELESKGVVLAKEKTITCDSELITGTIFQENLIRTDNGLLYPYVIDLPVGTEIIMEYYSNGTAHPSNDDIVKVVERER